MASIGVLGRPAWPSHRCSLRGWGLRIIIMVMPSGRARSARRDQARPDRGAGGDRRGGPGAAAGGDEPAPIAGRAGGMNTRYADPKAYDEETSIPPDPYSFRAPGFLTRPAGLL